MFPKNLLLLLIPIFIISIFTTLFLAKTLRAGVVFDTAGTIKYDSSLTSSERAFLEGIFANSPPPTDLTISARDAFSYTPAPDIIVYSIHVPTTDFYSSLIDIPSAQLSAKSSTIKLIDLNQLTFTQKLLSIDDQYFFDTYTKGAKFRLFNLQGASATVASAVKAITPSLPKYPTRATTLSFNQTGVTALSRAMNTKLKSQSDATYFTQHIADFLKSSDFTHLSNEVSFVDNCQSSSNSTNLCSDPKMIDAITSVGTNIIELTGNHNNDYSATNNIKTIDLYHKLNIQTFGGGKNESEAAKPLHLSKKHNHFTLLGYNQSTSTKANGQGANGDNPGANIYDEATAKSDITSAKARGDTVIVDLQYFECYSYPAEGAEMPSCDAPISGQSEFFRKFIDFGADVVVGTQAHQPQTFELYQNHPIYYGLGNLFFDQTYWPGTTRSIILTHYFHDNKLIQTRLTPTIYDKNLQVKLMDKESASWFIDRLVSAH